MVKALARAIERLRSWPLGRMFAVIAMLAVTSATVAGGGLGPTPLFVPANCTAPFGGASATLLANGQVLIAGGLNNSATAINAAELYDPATGACTATANLTTPRSGHTATLLQDGTVLITGGVNASNTPLQSAELYNPAGGGSFTAVGNMSDSRMEHTATLLYNGQVLVAGGEDAGAATLNTAEVYDPASKTFTCVGGVSGSPPLCNASISRRRNHTATLLGDGTVLIAGGFNRFGNPLDTAEVLVPGPGSDPGSGSSFGVGPMNEARASHTATLLDDGTVLIAGGSNGADVVATAEIYVPNQQSFQLTANASGVATVMTTPRRSHTATLLANGTVLLAGGVNNDAVALASAEIYTPATGVFSAVASQMQAARSLQAATVLDDGMVLVAGGAASSTSDLFDPTPGFFVPTGTMEASREFHTATLMPNGATLIAGGENSLGVLASTELYDGAIFSAGPVMSSARSMHTATLSGTKVLLAGGLSDTSSALSSGEIYDSVLNTISAPSNSMAHARFGHTASLLANNKVLLAGGMATSGAALNTAELFNWATTSFSKSHSKMIAARAFDAATVLKNGQVLITGGRGAAGAPLNSAELYLPGKDLFAAVAATMVDQRMFHSATLLNNGKVLIAGGRDAKGATASAEIFDPAAMTFTRTGSMLMARYMHSASLLPDGRVVIAGGVGSAGTALNEAEIFDPATSTFTPAPSPMLDFREAHTATLLPSGLVLLAGGADNSFNVTASAELYDPIGGPAPAGFMVMAGGNAASGRAGATVNIGTLQTVAIAAGPQSVSSVTLRVTNARLFRRLSLRAAVGGVDTATSQVAAPGGIVVFRFDPPVAVAAAQSVSFTLDGALAPTAAPAAVSRVSATAIGTSSGAGTMRVQGLPAGVGILTVAAPVSP